MTTNAQMLSEEILLKVAGIDDVGAMRQCLSGKKALILGAGDLVRKKAVWIALLKLLGVDVYLADTRKNPVALDLLSPYVSGFFVIDDGVEERELIDIGRKEPFDILDISTWGDTHLAMALRFQNIAKLIVDTKPVDTHLDLLRTIHKYIANNSAIFGQLVSRLLVHDHYGGRWILPEAAKEMRRCHDTHGFVTSIQIYILESRAVNNERERIDALRDGIALDLMPHAFRVLQSMMPIGATWVCGDLRYTRQNLSLSVVGGAREHNVGCIIPGQIETFAAVSMEGQDIVQIDGQPSRPEHYPFRCLVAVGKGVTANHGDSKDVKGVAVKFETGESLEIDLESQRMRTPDGKVMLPPREILHRGINLPLIELVKTGMTMPLPTNLTHFFQPLDEAYMAAELIDKARKLPWLGRAYTSGEGCVHMINSIPREWWGTTPWQLQGLPQIQIGDVLAETLIIP